MGNFLRVRLMSRCQRRGCKCRGWPWTTRSRRGSSPPPRARLEWCELDPRATRELTSSVGFASPPPARKRVQAAHVALLRPPRLRDAAEGEAARRDTPCAHDLHRRHRRRPRRRLRSGRLPTLLRLGVRVVRADVFLRRWLQRRLQRWLWPTSVSWPREFDARRHELRRILRQVLRPPFLRPNLAPDKR